jgi:acyl carrier protein
MNELKQLLADILDIDISEVNCHLNREECEQWDSFNHLLVISEIESKFGIKFTMEEVESIKNYEDLEKLINK